MPSGSGNTAVDKVSGVRAGDLVAGSYRVERLLGTGGMGVVVAAIDERTGEAVAVKLLQSVDDTRAVERFFREARAMGKLDSEHVVRVRDAGSDGKKPYLVMDRLEGVDLSQHTKRSGPLDVQQAADLAIQACEALSHAHSKGIVHRDIKPSNLFLHTVGGRTVLKVLDFGISKVQTQDAWERTLTTTDDGGVLGSPPYMSPEQVRDPKTVDSRSDVWSLGVVLYKVLSGAVPYDGDSVGEVFSKVLERPYPSLRVTTEVPAEIDAIVERCLAKNRDDRFAHVGELALALAAFASPEHAAIAPRIAQRMHDEGPTLAHSASVPPPEITPSARRDRGEPKTMTLSEPPPAARPSTFPSAPAPAPAPAPPIASRKRIAIILAMIAIASTAAIGLAVRGSASAAPRPDPDSQLASSASASALALALASASAPASASALASASASPSASTSASPSPSPPLTKSSTTRRVRKPPPGPPTTGTGAATTSRPELQPSPYPTPPP